MDYTPRTFTISSIDGISSKSIEEHIGLYNAYVKNFNALSTLLKEYSSDSEKHAHALSELIRRRSFEFDGMRLHELYFEQISNPATLLDTASPLSQAISAEFGSHEAFFAQLRAVAMMRGPGWAILYADPQNKRLHLGFAGEQHQGHFATLPIIFALDVWEHAFILDYGALGKGKYIDSYLAAVDWSAAERRFSAIA